jgi:hypothetical protein
LDFSLGIETAGSHVPYKSLVWLRAAYMPDAARSGFRATPALIPGEDRTPGFDIAYGISTLHPSMLSLASGKCADHADTPMLEEGGVGLNQLLKEAGSPNLASLEALELPHRPGHECQIDVSEHGLQRCTIGDLPMGRQSC